MVKQDYPTLNGLYKHYKGGTYKVMNLAKHTETDEILVIYQSIEFGSYHARPLTSWNEIALVKPYENSKPIKTTRFTQL